MQEHRTRRRSATTSPEQAFGIVLRTVRTERGLSQEDLAERTGLSVRTIRYLESGRAGRPRPETARLLADAFGLQGEEREQFHVALAPG